MKKKDMNRKYVYTVVGLLFVIIAFIVVYNKLHNNRTPDADRPEQIKVKTERTTGMPSNTIISRSRNNAENPAGEGSGKLSVANNKPPLDNTDEDDFQEQIDTEQFVEAEEQNTYNKMFEAEARTRLPLISIQTHNPVWVLEQEAEQKTQEKLVKAFVGVALGRKIRPEATDETGSETETTDETESESTSETEEKQLALPAEEYGEFGKLQPPEREIWIRVEPEYAQESRDIMAQNADLYRESTGYEGEVAVTLWVGGQPYYRQVYE